MIQKEASQRFSKIANNFVTSEVHTMSPTIKKLHGLLNFEAPIALCDIACGAGHTALSFTSQAERIVGVDPSPQMLAAFKELAKTQNVVVEVVEAFAESLPLADNEFDLVTCRLAPHHFSDLEQAVKEMARIVKPGGLVAVIDLEGDENPFVDQFNHQLEVLHDPTHVRSYTLSTWQSRFQQAGLLVETAESKLSERPSGLPVHRWCSIAASGEAAEAEIISLLKEASDELLESLGITYRDEEFFLPIRTLLILGRKHPRS